MDIEIVTLKSHPEYVSRLAQWALLAWGKYNPHSNLEDIREKFKMHLNEHQLPLTYVAVLDDHPIGMCSLRETDGIRPEWMPWLGSLYVEPAYRERGIGKQLIQKISHTAHEMGYSTLYLLTFEPDITLWYEKQRWKTHGRDTVNGHPVDILIWDLK